jgi:hypothetical protein
MQNDNAAEQHAIVGGAAAPVEQDHHDTIIGGAAVENAMASSETDPKLRLIMQETGLTQQQLDSSGTRPKFSRKSHGSGGAALHPRKAFVFALF